jgi:diguanylate cyclase (GGDEF)-like protein/PAS domain S-box-containing protein
MPVIDLIQLHDMRLVLVAVLICFLACYTSYSLLARGVASGPRMQAWWVATGAVTMGSGVWATHFIAMLAYNPPVPVGYDEARTLLSILAAIVISGVGLAIATSHSIGRRLLGGAVIGAAIGAMHYIGMSGWRLQGVLQYDTRYVIASVAVGIVLAGIATAIGLAKPHAAHRLIATAILALGMCVMHFTATAGVTVRPDPTIALPADTLPPSWLAIAVSAVSLLILCLSLGGAAVDERRAARALGEANRLRSSEARFRQLADATSEGILIHVGGCIVDANAVIADLIAVPIKQLIGRDVTSCVAEESRLPLLKHMAMNIETGREVELFRADGTTIEVEILTRAAPHSTGAPAVGDERKVLAVRDIRDRRLAEARIHHMAYHDPLTDLSNRRLFGERLQQELTRAKRGGTTVAVLCLDLDRFKQINDFGGHRAGDALLKQVAARLADCVRDEDVIGRLSGDEFVVLQVGVEHPGGPAILAERLIREIARPFDLAGQQTVIGTSVGIALHPANGETGEDLLRAADAALRRAKEAGKGTYRFFEPEMDARLQERRALEGDLRQALAKEELRIYYQPLVGCCSGKVLGFEALLRWTHSERGSIPPAHFIPLAEECGLMTQLGAWVMRKACSDAAGWPADRLVAVNLSPAQFRQPDLAKGILDILEETGLPACRLEIEITESLLIEDAERALGALHVLKQAGARISLDDFGTGYSSLSYLQRFPFDKIKIDRSFISQMEENEDSMSIVRAVIALGKALRIQVTAEGVETEAQLNLLRHEHCDLVQGYLLGRSMPLEKVGAFLSASEATPPLRSRSPVERPPAGRSLATDPVQGRGPHQGLGNRQVAAKAGNLGSPDALGVHDPAD